MPKQRDRAEVHHNALYLRTDPADPLVGAVGKLICTVARRKRLSMRRYRVRTERASLLSFIRQSERVRTNNMCQASHGSQGNLYTLVRSHEARYRASAALEPVGSQPVISFRRPSSRKSSFPKPCKVQASVLQDTHTAMDRTPESAGMLLQMVVEW